MMNLQNRISEAKFSPVVKWIPSVYQYIVFYFEPYAEDPSFAVRRDTVEEVEVDLMCVIDFLADPVADKWKTDEPDPLDAWLCYCDLPNISLRNFCQPQPRRRAAYITN
jgi:hypothetical protein